MSLDKIKTHLKGLSPKDLLIATKLLEKRSFYDLKDLVDSSIVILSRKISNKKEISKEDEASKYELIRLKDSVDNYLMKLDPSYFNEDWDDEDDFIDHLDDY